MAKKGCQYKIHKKIRFFDDLGMYLAKKIELSHDYRAGTMARPHNFHAILYLYTKSSELIL